MEDYPLYWKIVESIRQQVLAGILRPGDRLPPVRQMTSQWQCTQGTVLRAYQELARQGKRKKVSTSSRAATIRPSQSSPPGFR